MSQYTIILDWPTADVLAYAIQCTMDDLEARAIVAEHHDQELGPASAAEYRADIQRLRAALDQISPGIRPPDPEQAAVRWLDGTYTVAAGKPVRMLAQPQLRELLEASLALRDAGLLSPDDALDLLATAIDRGHDEIPAEPAHEIARTPAPELSARELTRDLDPPVAP